VNFGWVAGDFIHGEATTAIAGKITALQAQQKCLPMRSHRIVAKG